MWARSGREILYFGGDGALTRVAVEAIDTTWNGSGPVRLFEGPYYRADGFPDRTFDVSADGQRFLMIKQPSAAQATPPQIVVVQNWTEELKRLVPVN